MRLNYLIFKIFYECIRVFIQIAFPYGQNPPTGLLQLRLLFQVTLDRSAELFLPELRAGLRRGRIGASFMPMPEAAMDEDDGPVLRENDVRFPRQVRNMQLETEAFPVEQAAQHQFRFCVLTPDTGHVPAAAFF